MEVYVEIQCTTKSLYISHRPRFNLLLQVTSAMNYISGNRAMNDLHDFTELFGISSEQ